MKKITQQAVNAFYSKESKTLGNTATEYNDQKDVISLFLHNNKIAELIPTKHLFISSC